MDFNELLQQTNFTALDWVIVVAYPLISVVLGLIASRFIADMDDFVVAGRGIRTALGFATLTGTELGLVTVMYSAEMGFTGGFAAMHMGLAAGVVAFFVGLSGFIIAGLRRTEVLTISEYYGKRFGPRTRILGGVILAFGGILNMGMFLRAGSIFIVGITGMPTSHFFGPFGYVEAVMLALLLLVLFYTVMGGMISVVLADYVQFVVLSIGLILAIFLAVNRLGWNNIFDTVSREMGADGLDPFASKQFGWDYVAWMMFLGIVNCALWPTSVARALAAKSEQVVKRQFMLASASYAIRNIVPIFLGVGAFVLIMQRSELYEMFFSEATEAIPNRSLYAFPVFLGRILPIGLIGLISAAMLAAFMSTHDSYFLCWSSVLANDVVVPLLRGDWFRNPARHRSIELNQRQRVLLTRVLIVLIGVAIYAVSLLYQLGQNLWDYMAVTGAIYYSGAFALLSAGLY